MSSASHQNIGTCLSKGQSILINAIIHAVQINLLPACGLQRQHIAAFLMHPGKIKSRHILKRIMAGKNNFLCLHDSPVRNQTMPLHLLHRSVFKDRYSLPDSLKKFKRMKLRLIFK